MFLILQASVTRNRRGGHRWTSPVCADIGVSKFYISFKEIKREKVKKKNKPPLSVLIPLNKTCSQCLTWLESCNMELLAIMGTSSAIWKHFCFVMVSFMMLYGYTQKCFLKHWINSLKTCDLLSIQRLVLHQRQTGGGAFIMTPYTDIHTSTTSCSLL